MTAEASALQPGERRVLARADLGALFEALAADGRTVVGPTVRDHAICYEPIEGPDELPEGWTDEQGPGRYRIVPRSDKALFGYNLGPHSWKKFLHPARLRLWRATREGAGFRVHDETETTPKLAILGARACELMAITLQDRVFLRSGVTDPHYASRREGLFIVAAQCGQASATCFCPSMGSGPRVRQPFDLSLTELLEPVHRFIVEIGTRAGAALLSRLPTRAVTADEDGAPEAASARAEAQIIKRLDTQGLREKLLSAVSGPHWARVAERCLGCANCTMVCPTCFCTTVVDTTDLAGAAERTRLWDSCFTGLTSSEALAASAAGAASRGAPPASTSSPRRSPPPRGPEPWRSKGSRPSFASIPSAGAWKRRI